MATVDWSAIYLGNIADMDTDESTMTAEGAANLLTTFGSAGAPLSDNVVTLTTTSNDNTIMERDNAGSSDTLTFENTPGGTTSTTGIDSIVSVDVTISFGDGTSGDFGGSVYIMQDTDGNLFFLITDTYGNFVPKLFEEPIDSIQVNEISGDARPTQSQSSHDSRQFASTSSGPTICFLAGTRLQTPIGEVAVEDLAVGDFVDTLDDGPLDVLWIGRQVMNFPDGGVEIQTLPHQGRGLRRRSAAARSEAVAATSGVGRWPDGRGVGAHRRA